MGEMEIRTDLALESREGVASSLDVKRDVICSSVEKLHGIKVSTVEITSEKEEASGDFPLIPIIGVIAVCTIIGIYVVAKKKSKHKSVVDEKNDEGGTVE